MGEATASGEDATEGEQMNNHWYGVKCVFEHHGLADDPGARVYEERVVLIRAVSFEAAIAQAETEAREYARGISATYLNFADAFETSLETVTEGAEVYSLMRETHLAPKEFIDHYYGDGTEKSR